MSKVKVEIFLVINDDMYSNKLGKYLPRSVIEPGTFISSVQCSTN